MAHKKGKLIRYSTRAMFHAMEHLDDGMEAETLQEKDQHMELAYSLLKTTCDKELKRRRKGD